MAASIFNQFATHRSARIYPALAVNILIIEIALYAAGQIYFTRSLAPVWAFFFFVSYVLTASYELASQWVGSGGGRLSYDGLFPIYPSGVLWTLTVELSFYLTIPFIGLLKSRVSQTALIVVASLASFAVQQMSPTVLLSISVLPYFWILAIGMVFYLWQPRSSVLNTLIPVLALAYVAFVYWRGLPWFEWKTDPKLSVTVQTTLLSLLALCIGSSPLLKSRFLAKFDVSYGVYLYHMLFVTALMNVTPSEKGLWMIAVVWALSIIFGLISWLLVERPAMNRARQLI